MGQLIFDGNVSFRGGQNAGILADRIREDQYASGVNVTTVDGGLSPRPGFVHQEIKVRTEGGVTLSDGNRVSYSEIFSTGKFQGASSYLTDAGEFIVAVISGVIFKIDPLCDTADVIEVTKESSLKTPNTECIEPNSNRLNQYCRRVNFAEAGRFLVIFDYPDFPVIIDGSTAKRADPKRVELDGFPCPEVPASVIGAFNQNRLFVGSAVHEFTGGDPVGNALAPDAPITFKEIFIEASEFLGQSFSLGTTNSNNPITAMGFIQVVDTSTGIGPLFVATKNSIYTFRTDIPRSQWEQTRFGSLLLFNAGIAGQRAFTHLNSDLIFMSGDGQIRSLSMARREQGQWANTPIDREIRNWVRFDDRELISLTVAESFRNRVFITVDPFRIPAKDLFGNKVSDFAFGGIVVLELDNVSGIFQDATPAWAGLWTGIYPMDLVQAGSELYLFSKDPNSVNRLYKLDEGITYDIFQGKRKQVTSRIYTREYSFQDKFLLKEEKSVEPTLREVEGELCLKVDRKSESASNWSSWKTFKHLALTDDCNISDCGTRPVKLPHKFRELNLGDPESSDLCNPVTDDDLRYFRKMQYRITINAKSWKLEDFRAGAELQEDDNLINITCSELKEKTVEKDCRDISDWLIHRTPFDNILEGVEPCQ